MPVDSVRRISVIVPKNPFVPSDLQGAKHCLAALDVCNLMEWWPGKPHSPHRNPKKVRAIQRSLDWKRVTQIAAYLLQEEIVDAPDRLNEYFGEIYGSIKKEPGRTWPPRVPRVTGFVRSSYPVFSNVLIHVNGAKVRRLPGEQEAATLTFDAADPELHFFVIDGQHRINGAYLAVMISRKEDPDFLWEIPAEIFIDLDQPGKPPQRQAQIFIDVNYNQKKVDRSLVADLFPTARQGNALNNKERAQDLGRRLMLEIGPLVGMIQIPGIKYGVSNVVTLATLNRAIEDIIDDLVDVDLTSLDDQSTFLAQCLDAWLTASGRKEELTDSRKLSATNVVYQGRIMVSFITLVPACIWKLKKKGLAFISDAAQEDLTEWLRRAMKRADLLEGGIFIDKDQFKTLGFLGSGGIARFRDTLWCAIIGTGGMESFTAEGRSKKARENREKVHSELAK